MNELVSKAQLFASLPPPWPMDLRVAVREGAESLAAKLVVLDDDLTGTQTVYHLPVLTSWDVEELSTELADAGPCFYVLTNPRSLPPVRARDLARHLACNLRSAAYRTGRRFILVSRSDSTLRGHFPLETDVLAEELGPFDATVLVPYFEAGGRYTVLVAKGGITSSDLATRALSVRRAMVLGQIMPGVPVWRLGPETRFLGMPKIVFPGNVGDLQALADVYCCMGRSAPLPQQSLTLSNP